jgi:3-methyladenine DNA glycosylase AlkC
MNEKEYFNKKEIKNILKETKANKETKGKYRGFFEAEEKILKLIKGKKISEDSLQVILGILIQLKVIFGIYIYSGSKQLKLTNKKGFDSNSDFMYFKIIEEIKDIKELEVKEEITNIIKKLKNPKRKL